MGLFNFTKKKETVINSYNTHEADGAQVWMVSWDARHGSYSHDVRRVAKAFLSETDAKSFAQSLIDAKNLLQDTDNIKISIEKQA